MIDPQALSTILAWTMLILSAIIATTVIRTRGDIDWHASAAFALATLLLTIAAVISATGVLSTGPELSEGAQLAIVASRAVATALFLGVAMDLTGRPRWIGRILRKRR